jgi:hypothetical protein
MHYAHGWPGAAEPQPGNSKSEIPALSQVKGRNPKQIRMTKIPNKVNKIDQ